MREILISTPSVVLAITGFAVCLLLVLLDKRAEARQRERQQRLQEELARNKERDNRSVLSGTEVTTDGIYGGRAGRNASGR